MSTPIDDLDDIVRQLRTELDWALRTGIEVPSRRSAPVAAAATPEAEASPAQRAPATEARARADERPSASESPERADAQRSRERPTNEPRGRADEQRGRERPTNEPRGRGDAQRGRPNERPANDPRSRPFDGPPPQRRPVDEAPNRQPAPRQPAPLALLAETKTLGDVRDVLGDCTRCKLHSGRRQIVFGVGDPNAAIMFVGEGPGADEDRVGEPFVGKAGQLLTKIIESGMQLRRDEVYIANIVKCRPPRNRDPEPDEVEACEPFLKAQIRAVQPQVIIALGRYAAQTLLRDSTPITRMRGRWREYEGIPLMPTYHPAYLLRNPAEKRPVWEDIKLVMKKLGIGEGR